MRPSIYCLTLLTIMGCKASATPEEVFLAYSEQVGSAQHLTDIDFTKHFSNRAQATIAEDLSPVLVDASFSLSINGEPADTTTKVTHVADDESMFGFVLDMLRYDSELCSGIESNTTIDGKSAYVTCSEKDYTDQWGVTFDSYKRNISFVNEKGWRIDMIETEFVQDSGTMKSTTFK